MDWLNAKAPANMKLMYVTFEVSHELISWLKEEAPLNILVILVTLEVFHELILLLKAVAEANIVVILVTLEVSQFSMDWLNALAPTNIPFMFVTCGVLVAFALLLFVTVIESNINQSLYCALTLARDKTNCYSCQDEEALPKPVSSNP